MIWIILIAIVAVFIYLARKGNADIENVNKYGGLTSKYHTFINHIMSRNAYYQLNEINSNNVELTNTGMKYKLIEIDKKLQVTWVWNSFSTGKVHKLQWKFNESENQDLMYQKMATDISIQNLVDEGMTTAQATDWLKMSRGATEEEQRRLADEFAKKYPALWDKLSN